MATESMITAAESMVTVGQTLLGKYHVVREIGRGGMAAVYEAEQLSLGKRVAVKILASEMSGSTVVIERFFREARAAASIKSPYIVDVYDSGRLDDGRPFIAMELLEGESLYDRMARVRIIDVETTTRVIVHTAKGLMKAHAAGIVHRDLKPENIFLTKNEDGEDICKILDFGLAKFYAPVNPDKAQKRLTREGAVFGTPAYMSPEQVKGHGNVDHRADLWALGCMAYECLIGKPVWNMDQGVAMTFAAIATEPIPTLSRARPDLPRALDAWFVKCLERDPNARYQTAKELAEAFVQALGRGSEPSFPSFTQNTKQSLVLARAALSHEELASSEFDSDMSAPGVSDDVISGDGLRTPRPLNDVPTSANAPAKTSALRALLSTVVFAGAITLAGLVWVRFVYPQVSTPVVKSATSVQPSAASSAMPKLVSSSEEPLWLPVISEGQRLFTRGEYGEAQKKFQDAIAVGGTGAVVGRSFVEQTKFIEKLNGNCKPVFFSRPRLSTEKRAERPAIIATPKGALVTWTDDHEQDKRNHVYGALLDSDGHAISPIRDLTPEATDAQRPMLVTHSVDRSVLLWWDARGHDAGVRVRFIDADGRIDASKGRSVLVGAARPGAFWPSIDKGPDGSFFVVWQDDRDKDDDLFVRRLTNDLDTASQETRLTDYEALPKSKAPPPRVRRPSVAVGPGSLFVVYRLDKERERNIVQMRVPLADIDKGGLEEASGKDKGSRVLGDVVSVTPSDDNAPVDTPAIKCGTEGCFVAWHVEGNGAFAGAFAAMIDPKEGKVIWRKKLGDKSGHPSLAVNRGQVAVVFYDAGKIKLSMLSRDGVTVPSVLLRAYDLSGPRPSLAGVPDKNEWYLAWQDQESRNVPSEIYAARIVCR
ncbi:MAG: serine/threonine protein kinase [Polyangiaceae bacterium]|nr:serine/threonine protein kinase [Polyangiaceae bacterium]